MAGFGGDITEQSELIETVRLLLRRVGELERRIKKIEDKGVDE